jgi:pSer/pThr/pTyr-binding forkhead associated (FHA) protein
MSSCDIIVNDTSLSRNQCTLAYSDGNWILFDGTTEGKKSTNGTWVYVDDYFQIYTGIVFKACGCLFTARLID